MALANNLLRYLAIKLAVCLGDGSYYRKMKPRVYISKPAAVTYPVLAKSRSTSCQYTRLRGLRPVLDCTEVRVVSFVAMLNTPEYRNAGDSLSLCSPTLRTEGT